MPNPVFPFNAIHDFILNQENMRRYIRFLCDKNEMGKHNNIYSLKTKTYPEPPTTIKIKHSKIEIPTEDDLFWCFYIIHFGLEKYLTIHNFFTEEKKLKIDFVSTIRANKDILKQNKWKRGAIETDLVYEKKISLTTFICLCTIFNYSFMIIDERKVYKELKIEHTEKNKIHLIMKKKEEWRLYTEDDKEKKINEALDTFWIIDNFKKPLKGIGSYKVKDLKQICCKLNLDVEKKKKKELYQMISENL